MSPATHRGNGDLDQLRQAFTTETTTRGSEECPDTASLWNSAAGTLDPMADEAILLHVASCPSCTIAWKLARELLQEQGELGNAGPVSLDTRRPVWRRPAFLAMAATLLLAVGLGSGLLLRERATRPVVYRTQAQEIVLEPEASSLERPRDACELRWKGAPEGSRFDIIVTDPDVDVLYEARRLTESRCLVPAERLPSPGGSILWQVTAHLPRGGTVTSRTFETAID